jgi:hypothetical protein
MKSVACPVDLRELSFFVMSLGSIRIKMLRNYSPNGDRTCDQSLESNGIGA